MMFRFKRLFRRVRARDGIAFSLLAVSAALLLCPGCGSGFERLLEERETESPGPVSRYPLRLPRTGQTVSYHPGDDGQHQKGAPWPLPRFTDAGDGTVMDNLTGLMWNRDAGALNDGWSEVIAWVSSPAFAAGGHSDWRLANRNELRSLFNYGSADQAAWLGSWFMNIADIQYWSSSTSAAVTANKWYLHMGDSFCFHEINTTAFRMMGVRLHADTLPVTGQNVSYLSGDDGQYQCGLPFPEPRFRDNGDGTVTDALTGLMWLKSPPALPAGTWSDTLDYANNLSHGGYEDWRIPNINELSSLVDLSLPSMAGWLNGSGFENIQGLYYWTGTTAPAATGNAYYVSMVDGFINNRAKSETGYLAWPVRGGD